MNPESNFFKDNNYPPQPDYLQRKSLILDVLQFLYETKKILINLDHQKNYKNVFNKSEAEILKRQYQQSLRDLFSKFTNYEFLSKFYKGDLLNNSTERMFSTLYRTILKMEKKPMQNYNFNKLINKTLQPIIDYLKKINELPQINLSREQF